MARIYNLSSVTHTRKRLRNEMPPAEVLIWSRLKGKQLSGYKFRRQYSVGAFVLDFYCPAAKLAIEIDGESHVDAAYDLRRQQIMESLGIRFLRLTNHDVHRNLNGVIEMIDQTLQSALQTSPNPSLLRRGTEPPLETKI